MRAERVFGLVVALLISVVLAGCSSGVGGVSESTQDEDAAQAEADGLDLPDEGDISTPDSASAELYGAVEKFNEFSISFMATMVQNLEDAVGDLGLGMSKAFYGSFKEIRCGCEASREAIACKCFDADDGHCIGKVARSESDKQIFLGAISCEEFNLDADTVFHGSFDGKIWINSLILSYLGGSYGGFFADKEIGAEVDLDECKIDEKITRVCNLTTSVCSRVGSLVSVSLKMGDEGFALYDKCGDFEFSAGTMMASTFCFKSFSSFLSSFVLDGEFNGEPAYIKNNIVCNLENLIKF